MKDRRAWVRQLPGWCQVLVERLWPEWLKVRWVLVERWNREPLYCRALAGESDANICINSDLTVSCNCQDFDGQGHVGDLQQQTLQEIFEGARVADFQKMLAAHKMPTSVCSHCPELAVAPPGTGISHPVRGRVPHRGIMVENTALCNLRCALCKESRKELLGMRRQSSMSLEDVSKVAKMLSYHAVERVSYFNLGEPFISNNIADEMRIIRACNPDIRILTSTNGVLLDADGRMDAALMMDYVYISLDGVDQETVDRYQAGSDFERVFANMSELVRRRQHLGRTSHEGLLLPVVNWKYVLFRWNDSPEHVERALDLAKAADVDLLTFCRGSASRSDATTAFPDCHPFAGLGEMVGDYLVVKLRDVPTHLLAQ